MQFVGGFECGERVISVLHSPDGNAISMDLWLRFSVICRLENCSILYSGWINEWIDKSVQRYYG